MYPDSRNSNRIPWKTLITVSLIVLSFIGGSTAAIWSASSSFAVVKKQITDNCDRIDKGEEERKLLVAKEQYHRDVKEMKSDIKDILGFLIEKNNKES